MSVAMMRRTVLAPVLLVALAMSADGQELLSPPTISEASLKEPHPFGVQDLVRMERVGAPYPSPDGRSLVFTIRAWDAAANKATTNLWRMGADGANLRRLTSGEGQTDSSPAWSPDSRTVAFVSSRGDKQQIWTIAVDGGEARQLTSLSVDVDNLRWSPAGSHIAFSTEVYPDAGLAETAQRDKAKADDPLKAMKFDRLFIRHWDTWTSGKRNHVFVLPVKQGQDKAWQTAGEPTDLMKGVEADCPSKPFGGAEEFGWSPDGKEMAFTAQLGRDVAWSTDFNVFTVAVTGGSPKSITESNQATDTGPAYSPDGKTIAYRAMARPGFESDRYVIKLYDRASGQTRSLAESWDRSPGSLDWSADSKTLLVSAAENARQKLFTIDAATGKPQVVVDKHYNSGASYAGGSGQSRIVFAQDSLTSPAEIYSARVDGSDVKQLTHVTAERMKVARVSQPEEFTFKGANDESVQAWLIKPLDFQEGKKYPVAFIIHGGPQGAIDDHFHYRWNPQVYAAAGYAVIAVNFHGSTGFGQAFTDSISGDWGGKPFEDLMKGLDHALANYSWLDGERVGALGASYGGWMINWINGHTTRFKCLVNHDGGFDEFANYFTTEELWFPEWEFKGTPWERPELYDKFSPSRHVGRWATPTLVIHGANDFRLVDAEGIATFTALQRRGIPSQLLYFPDENHWILKPKNSIVWHETILAWLDKWLKK
jgi:dipeptidyl aminopeptidase/acylaminoacyl peptidase